MFTLRYKLSDIVPIICRRCYFKGLGRRWFKRKAWSKKSRGTVYLKVLSRPHQGRD